MFDLFVLFACALIIPAGCAIMLHLSGKQEASQQSQEEEDDWWWRIK